MHRKLVFIMTWLALAAIAVPAEAGLVTFVHALPPLADAVPSNNPVDIAFDGECIHSYEPYGAKLGPKQVEAGKHLVYFYEAKPQERCRGTVLVVAEFDLAAVDEIDVVLSLSADDQVAIRTFDNSESLDAAESFEAAIEVRSAAAGPTLQAVVKTGRGDEVESGDVINGGVLGPIVTTSGRHIIEIKKGPEVLDILNSRIRKDRAYWVYITGSVPRNTVDVLAIESLPDEEIPGTDPPPTPKYSGCCLWGICSQLSARNCQQSRGRYIGDVKCVPNPCK